MNLETTTKVFDLLEKGFTILAIVIGALWVYFNYFRSRVYRSRLEPKITGNIRSDDQGYYIKLHAELKNVGLSKVNIEQAGSGISVYTYEPLGETVKLKGAKWQHIGTRPVFKNHQWIEANETIEDQQLICISKGQYLAFRLVLRIVSKKISWKTKYIIYAKPSDIVKNIFSIMEIEE